MRSLTKAQAHLLIDLSDREASWARLRRTSHPWTRSSLYQRGLIDMVNHPHLDEVWFITDAGRAALADGGTAA